MPCRINRQKLWAGRLVLESLAHESSVFVTLTYREELCPEELVPGDLSSFLRALRKELRPRRIRFYGVGEYGTKTGRPHFHVALFGVSLLERAVIEKVWQKGFVHVGLLSVKSAMYVAKYITKRWIGDGESDPRAGGRRREFSRMSLRPGIGAEGLEATIASMMESAGSRAIAKKGDVPVHVMIEGRRFPLGRYLRRRMREELGWRPEAPPEVQRVVRAKRAVEDVRKVERQRHQSDLIARKRVELADSKRRLS